MEDIVEMPTRMMHLLFRFLKQNNGCLSKRAMKSEFSELTAQETELIERVFKDVFVDSE